MYWRLNRRATARKMANDLKDTCRRQYYFEIYWTDSGSVCADRKRSPKARRGAVIFQLREP